MMRCEVGLAQNADRERAVILLVEDPDLQLTQSLKLTPDDARAIAIALQEAADDCEHGGSRKGAEGALSFPLGRKAR